VNLQSDDFELFGVPAQFSQDRAELDARWKQLQREVHPDRFADQGQAAQRLALQWSVRINEAYQRLKEPIKRAAYLCELRGAPIRAHDNTAMPATFLVRQMQWREALEEADSAAALQALSVQTQAEQTALLDRLADSLDRTGDLQESVAQVRALMFIERFAREIDARVEQMCA
jgi:molecular chaperone HscB